MMIIDKCPHCNTAHVQTSQLFQDITRPNGVSYWRVLRCQNKNCLRLVLVEFAGNNEIIQIFPAASFELDTTAPISKEIRDEFREAGLCLGAGCYKASMVMSRRVLQRCLKEEGCTQHKLVDAIDSALEKGILRKAFKNVTEEIREYGNLGAHPDDEQLVNATKDNATHILDFCRLIIHDFYEVPAVASKLKKKRDNPN